MVEWAWGGVGFCLLIGLGILFALLKINDPALAARGEWLPIALVMGLWAWWLRAAIPRYLQAKADLEGGTYETIRGIVRYDIRSGVGFIQTLNYRLWVGSELFQVNQSQLFALQSGLEYEVHVTPRSRIFLDATAIPTITPPSSIPSPTTAPLPHDLEPLTEREQEILGYLAAGYSNKEIAQLLSLSVNTIKMYTSQLYQKMGVSRRTEAVARAREWGLLP